MQQLSEEVLPLPPEERGGREYVNGREYVRVCKGRLSKGLSKDRTKNMR